MTIATLRPLLDEQAGLRDEHGALPDDVVAALHRDAPFGLSAPGGDAPECSAGLGCASPRRFCDPLGSGVG